MRASAMGDHTTDCTQTNASSLKTMNGMNGMEKNMKMKALFELKSMLAYDHDQDSKNERCLV